EDGQVDVDEELGIDAPRHGVVTGGHAEVIDALRHLARDTCLAQGTRRPGGAPELVVVGAGIVDRVVEPEGDPDLGGALALPLPDLQEPEALAQVAAVVVVPKPGPPGRLQLAPQALRRRTSEPLPGAGPVAGECRVGQRSEEGSRHEVAIMTLP